MDKITPKKPIKALEGLVFFLAAGAEATTGTIFELALWPIGYTISKTGSSDLKREIKESKMLTLKPHFNQVKEYYNQGIKCLQEAYK